jgi:hypothetical protein
VIAGLAIGSMTVRLALAAMSRNQSKKRRRIS